MKKLKNELVIKLIVFIGVGIGVGLLANVQIMSFIVLLKEVLGEIIFFTIPLIILAFVATSITELNQDSSKLVLFSLILAYLSTFCAAMVSLLMGYSIIPRLAINPIVGEGRIVPESLVVLNISPIMSVMSALVLSLLLGTFVAKTDADLTRILLKEFQIIVLEIVNKVVLKILPLFIGSTFAILAYQGNMVTQLPTFIIVIGIVFLGQCLWLVILYTIAALYTRKNPMKVIVNYGEAYVTALGTMSSAATLPVALKCAKKSPVLKKESIDFGIPLFSNIHLCGSVLTEVFLVLVVSNLVYGHLPRIENMIVFILLLGVLGIGAPGVPGGTVMASLGILISVLGFDTEATALMLTIFALQDSLGTACNVLGDRALVMILSKLMKE